MPVAMPVYLASRSPRRRAMLADAGVPVEVCATIDDGPLRPGAVSPADWTMALAYLKARSASDRMEGGEGTVLGADTVCVVDDRPLGQPRDEDEARAMLRSFAGRAHAVVTGVCLLDRHTGARTLFADEAMVHWDDVSGAEMEEYLAGGAWRGKAGGYNLEDRVGAGWGIRCEGDPTTVMGLPMQRLQDWLPPRYEVPT